MKKIKFIVVMIVVLAMVMAFVGCTEQQVEEPVTEESVVEEPVVEEVEPATEEPVVEEPEVVETRLEWANAPADAEIPEGYSVVTDDVILSSLAYPVYAVENEDGSIKYVAYANEVDSEGNVISSDWYTYVVIGNVVFTDVPFDVEIPADYEVCEEVVVSGDDFVYGFTVYESVVDDETIHYIYGSVYDAETGELLERKWIEVSVDDKGVIDVVDTDELVVTENSGSEDNDTADSDSSSDKKGGSANNSTSTGNTSSSGSSGNSGGSTGNNGASAPSEPKTEQVWVVDVPAHTVEEPVYEEKEVSICNTCGAYLTTQDDLDSHIKAHMLKGENGSWHSDYVQVQVGTKTVEIPEQGHWETRVVE